ncbi:MAG: Flp pilus assembly protein CpaB [Bdellovibrionales bacterium RIFOXYD1_FULL_53_11]|nr:MAG: Flp pilus assembly protein CpaB [Bdellovibrionales bacterium RIFOXYD1_FULL_53_11]
MNNKALTLSLVMAVIAVFFVQSYVSSIEDTAKEKYGTEVVVIKASKDIKEHDTIDQTMLRLELIPKSFVEPAAVSFGSKINDPGAVSSMNALSGSIAMVPIKKGEQITYNKLTEPGIRTGLAPQITPGRRAVPIPVSEITGVSKLVKPGDRVDLVAIIDLGGGKENKIAKTILQDVVVLSVGKSVSNNVARVMEADPSGRNKVRSLAEDFNFSSVTIEVEPAQAQMIALVLTNGEISLSLRNNDDSDRVAVGATALGDVLGADAARLQRLPAARR